MNKIELLAPAGDLARCKTAIIYGADAVYIGGKQLSLRSRAGNFSLAEIKEAVDFAHQHHARIHVTVNMIPHDDDLSEVDDYLKALGDIGVDAIICASLDIMKRSKKVANKMEVHVSTQQTTTNSAAIEFFNSVGADRVVLGRELSVQDIKATTKNSVLPTEVFIHGGMCVNYSGRCILSNQMTNRDANRGGCAQSCRWKYRLYDGEEMISPTDCLFSMSSKDLQAVHYIKDLIDSGVSSLKIEGRMKTAYYLAIVVSTYRKIIDSVYQNEEIDYSKMDKYIAKAENRPTDSGFLAHLPNKDTHLYGVNGAGVIQDFIANVLDYQDGIAKIQVRNHFTVNTKIEVINPQFKPEVFTIKELKDEDGNEVEVANKPMQVLYTPIPFKVSCNDYLVKANGEENE